MKLLNGGDATLSFCYEAGPCSYGTHRQFADLGWDCIVRENYQQSGYQTVLKKPDVI